jgi:SpoVK/Ycf46/Vps4 family AAA+-type ATPase
VLDDWDFRSRLLGRGVVAAFAGPPGTGKTLAARIVAASLRRPLYRVDLGQVVDKYIGETQKNLDRVLDGATGTGAVLLFDEADALFGRRTEVRDAHDRYANLEIAHLLARLEEYDGLAILTTNLRDHLDDAFTRRVAMMVPFEFPDLETRRLIWQRTWPAAAPMHPSVDPADYAHHRLTGAGIRDAMLRAAFFAAGRGDAHPAVTAADLHEGVRRELIQSGRAGRASEQEG